ncbi:MAG: MerR family transcriptional regulator [Pseudomonadota bacterium]
MRTPPKRVQEKSAEAFRTISEVSNDLDLPQHVLRFWETRFAQVKPMKRGGGRRLYRPDHVALLRGIKALLYDDGMTIKGVQKMLRESGAKTVIARGKADATLSLEPTDVSVPAQDGMLPLDLPEDTPARLAGLKDRITSERKSAEAAKAELDPSRIARSIDRLEALLEQLNAMEEEERTRA